MPAGEIDQFRNDFRLLRFRYVCAIATAIIEFFALLPLAASSGIAAAKYLAIIVFALTLVYSGTVWYRAYQAGKRLRLALAAHPASS